MRFLRSGPRSRRRLRPVRGRRPEPEHRRGASHPRCRPPASRPAPRARRPAPPPRPGRWRACGRCRPRRRSAPPGHVHVDRPLAQEGREMGRQLHVAVPRHVRPLGPGHRHPVAARIGERQGLQAQVRQAALLGLDRRAGGADERGAEGQEPGAVAGRALREQHDQLARREALAQRPVDLGGRPAARPVDEEGLLQHREPADHRPAGDLGLRHEGERAQAAQGHDVEPGDVVGQHQGRLAGPRRCAALRHPHAEEAQEQAVEQHRRPAGGAPEAQAQPVRADEQPEGRGHHREAGGDADPCHRGSLVARLMRGRPAW